MAVARIVQAGHLAVLLPPLPQYSYNAAIAFGQTAPMSPQPMPNAHDNASF